MQIVLRVTINNTFTDDKNHTTTTAITITTNKYNKSRKTRNKMIKLYERFKVKVIKKIATIVASLMIIACFVVDIIQRWFLSFPTLT